MTSAPDPAPLVTLRRADVTDAELLQSWRAEPSARRYQPLRVVPLPQLRAQLETEHRAVVDPRLQDDVRWMIETAEGPVGWISLREIQREHGIAAVGYTIGKRFRGRGYATAALHALLPIAFGSTEADLFRLQAVAAIENRASRRVLERAGFAFEGIARALLVIDGERVDHACYALLRPHWEERTDRNQG